MISKILKHRLVPILHAEQTLRRHRLTALAITLACLVGLGIWKFGPQLGIGGPAWVLGWVGFSIFTVILFWKWLGTAPMDLKKVARELEERFPEQDDGED